MYFSTNEVEKFVANGKQKSSVMCTPVHIYTQNSQVEHAQCFGGKLYIMENNGNSITIKCIALAQWLNTIT